MTANATRHKLFVLVSAVAGFKMSKYDRLTPYLASLRRHRGAPNLRRLKRFLDSRCLTVPIDIQPGGLTRPVKDIPKPPRDEKLGDELERWTWPARRWFSSEAMMISADQSTQRRRSLREVDGIT